MSFPGGKPIPGLPQDPSTAGMSEQEKQMVKYMQAGMESCIGKSVMSGVMGGGFGALFGLFMSSMRYDTPLSSPLNPASTAAAGGSTAQSISDLPLRQQLKHGFRDMYQSAKSSGKNFAMIGSIYAGVECGIEDLRAKNDLGNSVAAGCITGGILARNAGVQAMGVGCVGFAAFSAAIDMYMRGEENEVSRPIA